LRVERVGAAAAAEEEAAEDRGGVGVGGGVKVG
jgi:hypothetical protein